jgi:hypothetical protein
MTVPARIIGADRLVERFGHWPSFHDAEVLRTTLGSHGVSGPVAELLVHTWTMTDAVDANGYYVLEKHTLVRFIFEQLASCEMTDHHKGAVLLGIDFEPETVNDREAIRVTFDPCMGFGGTLTCGRVVLADVTACDAGGHSVGEG